MVPGVVLAAGASARMGRTKALLPTGMPGETFLSRIASTLVAAGVDDVVVVVDAARPEVAAAGRALPGPIRLVANPEPQRGQLSSMLAALDVVDRPGVLGMLVTLADVPLVSVETVRALLAAHRRTRAPVVRPEMEGAHGHPVIFDRAVFDELRRATAPGGAKIVIRAHAADELCVRVSDPGAFLDVDTPEDYERAFGRPFPGGA